MTGLSFELTAEQEELRQMVRDFADRECPKDVARRLEASKDFPEELARRIAKAGLNGIGVPEEYGGQGGDLLDQTLVRPSRRTAATCCAGRRSGDGR